MRNEPITYIDPYPKKHPDELQGYAGQIIDGQVWRRKTDYSNPVMINDRLGYPVKPIIDLDKTRELMPTETALSGDQPKKTSVTPPAQVVNYTPPEDVTLFTDETDEKIKALVAQGITSTRKIEAIIGVSNATVSRRKRRLGL